MLLERLQLLVGASSAWNLVNLAPWSQVHDSCKSSGICVMNLGEIHRLLSSTLAVEFHLGFILNPFGDSAVNVLNWNCVACFVWVLCLSDNLLMLNTINQLISVI